MEKLERQLGLLAALLHTERPLRASEIHRQVEGYPDDAVAFRRAFERDKDDLRRLGVPLQIQRTESNDGPIDGYRVAQGDYYLHDLGLEPDEVIALSVALRLIKLEGPAAADALWKLGGSPDVQADGGPHELAEIAMGPVVTELHEAITASAPVGFEYRGETRRVEPWRLAFRRGHWYLSGFDVDRADARSFRLDRIEGSVVTGDPGTCTADRTEANVDRQPWQFTTEDEVVHRARLAIDASDARWARHHLRDATLVVEHDDGSVELELDVTNVAGFRSLVLSMFEAAEILSPPALRQDMIDWLQGLTS